MLVSRLGLLALVLTLTGSSTPYAGGASSVKIHEVFAGPAGYIDLHNVGATTVQLGGWSVRSCAGRAVPADLAVLPAASAIPAGGHFFIAGLGFDGPDAQELVVSAIPGDGEMLLDRQGVRADSVGWAPASACRENLAARPCPGLAESRDAQSTDTDDNRADFGCARPLGEMAAGETGAGEMVSSDRPQ